MGEHPFGEGRPPWGGNSLMDSRWKKTVIRSTRFSPVLMDMIKTECKCRRIDFSNYIRLAATAAMKHKKETGSAKASRGSAQNQRGKWK